MHLLVCGTIILGETFNRTSPQEIPPDDPSKKGQTDPSPEEVDTFARALKFRASADRFRFRHSRDDRGDQTRFKAFFDRATASETRCSSYSCSFFSTIPRPFLSFRSRSTFLARRRSALFKRRTFGKRRFYAIPSGRAFRFRSGRFFELSLIKLNESQRRSDAVIFHRARALKRTQMQRTASSIFLGNIRLAADTITAKFNCKRENFRSISFLSFLSRRPRTSGYAANFKPGFSDSTDR